MFSSRPAWKPLTKERAAREREATIWILDQEKENSETFDALTGEPSTTMAPSVVINMNIRTRGPSEISDGRNFRNYLENFRKNGINFHNFSPRD